jgi:maleate isomerase
LQALGANSISLVTPYIDEINEREVEYFRSAGVRTVASSGLGVVGNLPKGRLPLSASDEAARRISVAGADVLVISCTNWLTLGNLESLTADLGIPVVSSNAALAWALLRAAGVSAPVDGVGVIGKVAMGRE